MRSAWILPFLPHWYVLPVLFLFITLAWLGESERGTLPSFLSWLLAFSEKKLSTLPVSGSSSQPTKRGERATAVTRNSADTQSCNLRMLHTSMSVPGCRRR